MTKKKTSKGSKAAADPPAVAEAPKAPPAGMTADAAAALLRWRLALGSGAEDAAPDMSLTALGGFGASLGLAEGSEDGEVGLADLDAALAFVYGGGSGSGGGGYGRANTRITVPRWLGLVR